MNGSTHLKNKITIRNKNGEYIQVESDYANELIQSGGWEPMVKGKVVIWNKETIESKKVAVKEGKKLVESGLWSYTGTGMVTLRNRETGKCKQFSKTKADTLKESDKWESPTVGRINIRNIKTKEYKNCTTKEAKELIESGLYEYQTKNLVPVHNVVTKESKLVNKSDIPKVTDGVYWICSSGKFLGSPVEFLIIKKKDIYKLVHIEDRNKYITEKWLEPHVYRNDILDMTDLLVENCKKSLLPPKDARHKPSAKLKNLHVHLFKLVAYYLYQVFFTDHTHDINECIEYVPQHIFDWWLNDVLNQEQIDIVVSKIAE